jgi:hypothetical protein
LEFGDFIRQAKPVKIICTRCNLGQTQRFGVWNLENGIYLAFGISYNRLQPPVGGVSSSK